MSVPAAVRARWRVHLPTALETRVRAIGGADPRDPWPSARALDALLAAGAVRDGPPRAVGAGAGPPLIASQRLRWAGVELEVEEPTPSTLRARLRRHLGLLVPESVAGGAGAAADAYRRLPRSGLVLLLR